MKAKELIEAIRSAETLEMAKDLANRFLLANSAGASSKVDLYAFCGREIYRPQQTGIYFDPDGYRVATNSYVMLATKNGFNAELSGQIIGPKGEKIEGRFPEWRGVIPKLDAYKPIEIPDLNETIKQYRIDRKEAGKYAPFAAELAPRYFINAGHMELVMKAAIELGSSEIYVPDAPTRAALIISEKGYFLIMPMLVNDGSTLTVYRLK